MERWCHNYSKSQNCDAFFFLYFLGNKFSKCKWKYEDCISQNPCISQVLRLYISLFCQIENWFKLNLFFTHQINKFNLYQLVSPNCPNAPENRCNSAFKCFLTLNNMLKPELNTFDCYGDTFKTSMVGRFLTNWKEVIRLSFIIRRYLYLSNAWKIHPGRFPSTYSSIKYNKIQIGTELALLIYSTTETITGFILFLLWV